MQIIHSPMIIHSGSSNGRNHFPYPFMSPQKLARLLHHYNQLHGESIWLCSLIKILQHFTFFINGITQGFRIGFDHTLVSLKSSRRNLESAQSHIAVVDDYLKTEITLAHVAGPFSPNAVGQGQISCFGVIPKNHQPDKWRLIVDLSYPSTHSINDGIPSALCSLQYVTIDDAVQHILKLGVGTLLAKIDIKSAFRLLLVHPADRHLLLMRWNDCIFIDTCLPFGLHSAPKLFNILADLLQWIA